jgi:DNA-binding beta-propeller fold protein YncE
MLDLNNRPGGPNLIVTAKTAHKVHFLDAATLELAKTIDMPGSTHELALSPDGRTAYGSIYGDGIFIKRINPDRRIAVIDLPSQSLSRVIDLGAVYAPHGVVIEASGALWCSGELGNAILVVDPADDRVQRIDVGGTAHWLVISDALGKAFVSVKGTHVVVIDVKSRAVTGRINVPEVTEGIAISPNGERVYVCAQTKPEFYVIDALSHQVLVTVSVPEPKAINPQMRRVRVSPDDQFVLISSNQGNQAAIFATDGLKLIASFPTKKSPMGFGFAPDGKHAYLCCHDEGEVFEFELASGKITRTFPTAAGCEFIVAYH